MMLPTYLTRDAEGEIRLSGHRIGLYTVVRCFQEGQSAEQISVDLPSLPLELIQQVLEFYRSNQEEVDAWVAAYRAELGRQEREHVPGPGVVRIRHLLERIREADLTHASDPTWTSLDLVGKLRRLELEETAEAP
jgi:uncharacterized protein (DUF433 family)